jgi:hypothetical protein
MEAFSAPAPFGLLLVVGAAVVDVAVVAAAEARVVAAVGEPVVIWVVLGEPSSLLESSVPTTPPKTEAGEVDVLPAAAFM